MNAGLIVATAGQPAAPPGLDLFQPLLWSAVTAAAAVVLAGLCAWGMTGWVRFSWWFTGSVHAGPAWTAKDSWVTNIAAVGAVLGTVLSNTTLNAKFQAAAPGLTLLYVVFGGVAALAPLVYGATAKLQSQGITDTTGSVWGFLLAGVASLFAVLGELATLGLLVMSGSDSPGTRAAVVVSLCAGALVVVAYSVRALTYFATLPAPRPKAPSTSEPAAELAAAPPAAGRAKPLPPAPAPVVRQSLLGNQMISGTL
jgi:hypothetical protein